MPGFKYNMPDVLAAIGLAQLKKLERMQVRRREVVKAYGEAFADLPLRLPVERGDVESAWHLYPVRLLDEAATGRDGFIEQMNAEDIGTSVHFIPVHFHPYYQQRYGWPAGRHPQAENAFERLVSLPLHGGLDQANVDRIIRSVRRILSGADRA